MNGDIHQPETRKTQRGELQTINSPRQVLFASLIGTAIEFFDFYIYATAAVLVFPKLFFPASDPATATLSSLATFGIAFLARPIGSALFGHFGDRVGRKATLVAALLTMGVSTVLIGLLPTYGTIGIAAPVLLSLCRIGQGLGLGGEWGGAVLLATENAPPGKRAVVRNVSATWRADWFSLLGRRLRFALPLALRRAVLHLWVADSLSGERGARRGRPLCPAHHRRDPGLPGSDQSAPTGEGPDADGAARAPGNARGGRSRVAHNIRYFLSDDGVRPRMGYPCTGLHTRAVFAHSALRNPLLRADDSLVRRARRARATAHVDERSRSHFRFRLGHATHVRSWLGGGDPRHDDWHVAGRPRLWTSWDSAGRAFPHGRALHRQLAHLQPGWYLWCVTGPLCRNVAGNHVRSPSGRLLSLRIDAPDTYRAGTGARDQGHIPLDDE